MSGDLNAIDEQAFEVLLSEAHGGRNPPDLSREILARMRDDPSIVAIRSAPVTVAKSGAGQTRLLLAAAIVAGLAASSLMLIWLRGGSPGGAESAPIASHNSGGGVSVPQVDLPDPKFKDEQVIEAIVQANGDELESATDSTVPTRKQPRGIPLLVDSGPGDNTQGHGDPQRAMTPSVDGQIEPVTLVSQNVDADLHAYWQAIGIEPAPTVSAERWAARCLDLLGIELSPASIADADLLRAEIASPQVATNIARRWLTQITDGGLARVDEQQRNALIEEVASCLRGERRLDQTLAAWIGGQKDGSPDQGVSAQNSSAFYAAISTGQDGKFGHDTMARRLAAVSMNVDLRCTRCHDARIEGTGRQEDYWSFAAFLKHGVKRSDGQWLVIDDDHTSEPVFYELPDGRQRIVEPGVPSTWLPGSEPVRNLHQFSQRILGSPSLAGGVVNSLWQLVHGRPLRGRVIDTMTAPHNDSLDQLERRLTGDLVRSGFDVRRTLALIISSPTTRREIPAPLLPENALVAGDADIRRAMDSVDAFAAALPPQDKMSLSGRLDLAMRSIGAKLDDLGSGELVFAQRIGDDTSNDKTSRGRDAALTGFPERSSRSLPVQWLERVKGYESRVDHLGYLAGMNQVSQPVREAADAMQAAGVSDELLLHRVWWLISP